MFKKKKYVDVSSIFVLHQQNHYLRENIKTQQEKSSNITMSFLSLFLLFFCFFLITPFNIPLFFSLFFFNKIIIFLFFFFSSFPLIKTMQQISIFCVSFSFLHTWNKNNNKANYRSLPKKQNKKSISHQEKELLSLSW